MIEKIAVTNFKSHAQTEIEVGRVTALVGPNGCGKSSFLKAIHCLGESVWRAWDQVFVGEQSPDVLAKKGKETFEIAAIGSNVYRESESDVDNYSWSVTIEVSRDKLLPVKVRSEWMGQRSPTILLPEGRSVREVVKNLETEIVDSIYFQAAQEKLKKPSHPESLPLEVAPDGSGLASVLANLKTTEDVRFSQIEDDLRAIVPSVKRIKVRRVQMTLSTRKIISVNETRIPYDEPREVIGDELIFDTISGGDIPAHAMSDGTLLALGIITLMHSPESPRLILLDDVEQGLHPLAQRQLIKTLKEFAEKHDKQILLTSHSGYIVDGLEAQDVWVMTLDSEGISRCRRLSDHQDAERLLEVLTTGELADAVGEDWVIDTPQVAGAAND